MCPSILHDSEAGRSMGESDREAGVNVFGEEGLGALGEGNARRWYNLMTRGWMELDVFGDSGNGSEAAVRDKEGIVPPRPTCTSRAGRRHAPLRTLGGQRSPGESEVGHVSWQEEKGLPETRFRKQMPLSSGGPSLGGGDAGDRQRVNGGVRGPSGAYRPAPRRPVVTDSTNLMAQGRQCSEHSRRCSKKLFPYVLVSSP